MSLSDIYYDLPSKYFQKFPTSHCNLMFSVSMSSSIFAHCPGWKNMAVKLWSWHASWHGHDDSWHDHDTITMFSMIHTMIMVWLSFSPFLIWKKDFISNFSTINAAIIRYMEHLIGLRGTYTSELPIQQKWTKNTPGSLKVFFCDSQTASSHLTIVSVNFRYYSFSLFLVVLKFWDRDQF